MKNITISIDNDIYKRMKNHSKLNYWSEFVRKCVQKRVEELEQLDKEDWENARFLGDEKLLAESWLCQELWVKTQSVFEFLTLQKFRQCICELKQDRVTD